jgi:hypothetical protein
LTLTITLRREGRIVTKKIIGAVAAGAVLGGAIVAGVWWAVSASHNRGASIPAAHGADESSGDSRGPTQASISAAQVADADVQSVVQCPPVILKHTVRWWPAWNSKVTPEIYLSSWMEDGRPIAGEVYVAAEKNPLLTTLSIELATDVPDGIIDRYGKDLKGHNILGTITVNGLDEIRRYKDDAFYATSNWSWYAEKVQNLCEQWGRTLGAQHGH